MLFSCLILEHNAVFVSLCYVLHVKVGPLVLIMRNYNVRKRA